MKIEEAIQQKKFRDEFQKAHINVLYTASWMHQRSMQALKPFNISWQQFNILRILRGMHPEPASVKLLTERMIDKMSNASRLVEKLKQKGLVERKSCKMDRRQVDVLITDKGLQLLGLASDAMDEQMNDIRDNLTPQQAEQLNVLLDTLRY